MWISQRVSSVVRVLHMGRKDWVSFLVGSGIIPVYADPVDSSASPLEVCR